MIKRAMTTGLLMAVLLAGFVGSQPAIAADASMCIGCHSQMGKSLKGAGVDAISAKIKDIAAGKNSMHDPVLAGASDEEIAAVAKALNEND